MENSPRCETCDVDIYRASMQKDLRSRKTYGKGKTKRNDSTRLVI